MISKLTLALFLALAVFKANAQTEITYVRDPQWNIISSYDSRSGSTLQLTNNDVAMIVNTPKSDFAVVCIGDKLNQKWISELEGFPMAIGKFKDNILVIAASDRSFFKSFTNIFKGYLLDEKTGKIISQKTIYEGSAEFIEQPEFFFAKDGSFFKMAVRVSAMRRKVHVGLPVVGFFTALKLQNDFRTTKSFSFIEFDRQLGQSQKTSPVMPAGQTWDAACNEDGSFMIVTKDAILGKCNISTYIAGNNEPLKTISIPVDFYRGTDGDALLTAGSKTLWVSYLAMMYKNSAKDQALLVAKVDFKTGTFAISRETFDKSHVKELAKSFVPANKKFDNLDFSSPNFMDVKSIEEHGDRLIVGISSSYIRSTSQGGSYGIDESVLLNGYDLELKPTYHQFIPRFYMSLTGEGGKVAYNKRGNVLCMVANQKDGISGVSPIYAEMDLTTGKMIKVNEIPKDHIKNSYYANTNTLWWQNNSFTIPFIERQGVFSKKVDAQLLQLGY